MYQKTKNTAREGTYFRFCYSPRASDCLETVRPWMRFFGLVMLPDIKGFFVREDRYFVAGSPCLAFALILRELTIGDGLHRDRRINVPQRTWHVRPFEAQRTNRHCLSWRISTEFFTTKRLSLTLHPRSFEPCEINHLFDTDIMTNLTRNTIRSHSQCDRCRRAPA